MGQFKELSIEEGAKYLHMDADSTGHYLTVLSKYHAHLDQIIRDKEYAITETQMIELYLLGNIEGRLLHDFIMATDIEMIEVWEQEVLRALDEGVGEP